MIVYPHAKINLGLRILHRRPDGYHDIESLMLPIGWSDSLSVKILPSRESIGYVRDSYQVRGFPEVPPLEGNLVYKAMQLLRQHHLEIPSLSLTLDKRIPTQAGLGGGSADAAYTLIAVNELCHLKLTVEQLEGMAGLLGSDCPFFIRGYPALATGRGEVLTPIPMPEVLRGVWLFVIKPPHGVRTAEAYSQVSRHPETEGTLLSLLQKPIEHWRDTIVNDFEQVVFSQYPLLEHLRDVLYQEGAYYAAMSGSGTAIYGLFASNPLKDRSTPLGELQTKYATWLERLGSGKNNSRVVKYSS